MQFKNMPEIRDIFSENNTAFCRQQNDVTPFPLLTSGLSRLFNYWRWSMTCDNCYELTVIESFALILHLLEI